MAYTLGYRLLEGCLDTTQNYQQSSILLLLVDLQKQRNHCEVSAQLYWVYPITANLYILIVDFTIIRLQCIGENSEEKINVKLNFCNNGQVKVVLRLDHLALSVPLSHLPDTILNLVFRKLGERREYSIPDQMEAKIFLYFTWLAV